MDTFNLARQGQLLLDTKGMRPNEGLVRWKEFLFEATPLVQEVQAVGGKKKAPGFFDARVSLRFVGEHALMRGKLTHDFTLRHVRGKSEIARTHADCAFLFLFDSGSNVVLETKREAAFQPVASEWTILSPDDGYCGTFGPGFSFAQVLTLPMQACTRMGIGSDSFGRRMSVRQPLNQLVANYIQTLADGGEIGGVSTAEAVARNLMELVALAVNAPESHETSSDGLASGLLLVLTQYLDTCYMEPDVSPAKAAKHAGITPRHVHRLFERTGTTFSERLYMLRLRRAHRMLADPHYAALRITDIACECGFSSLAHFVRRYHEMYGQTPGETRAG